MSRFTTYAIKEIASSFLLILLLLSGILWMGQGLRHIDLLTTENVSLGSYISYILLLLPKILLLTVPISYFLSILFNLNRLRNDSELIVLWASGKSDREILLKPILFISLLVFLFQFIVSIYLTPISLNEIRHKIIDIRSSGVHSSILKEKKFISPVDTLTIFIQERTGNKIKGLLIHDLKEKNKPQTYIAQNGEFINEDGVKILRLFNGNIQIFQKNEKRISEIEFETYDLNLTPYTKQEDRHVYSDELLTLQILNNLKNKDKVNLNKYEKEQFAELHSRIINPIYIFCFSLLPLIILKFSKKPGDGSILPISVVSIIAFVIQIIQITLSNVLITNNDFVSFNYLVPFILCSIIILLLFLDTFKLKVIKNA